MAQAQPVTLVIVAVVAGAGGFGLGWGLQRPTAPPSQRATHGPLQGAPIDPVTGADVAALRAAIAELRTQVAALEGAQGPDGAAIFLALERARFRAALRRQRAQVQAWLGGQAETQRAVAERAIQTLDAYAAHLDVVQDADGLADWFDRYTKTRQQWPAQHAWLLGDLTWR